MQPVGRTESIDRGCIVKHLERGERERAKGWKVEIARASTFFPGRRDFHRSWSKDAGLVGRDDFVSNAAPSDAAAEN